MPRKAPAPSWRSANPTSPGTDLDELKLSVSRCTFTSMKSPSSLLLALALAITFSLTSIAPTQARPDRTWQRSDPAGDMMFMDSDLPAPDITNGDISWVQLSTMGRRVRVKAQFYELHAPSLLDSTSLVAHAIAAKQSRKSGRIVMSIDSVIGPITVAMKVARGRKDRRVRCAASLWADYEANTVAMSFPRRCLGKLSKKIIFLTSVEQDGITYYDIAG